MKKALLNSLLIGGLLGGNAAGAADLIDFWDAQPRHGGNSFNQQVPDKAYFDALRRYGATWVRLSYDKWKPQRHDFLLGSADEYTGLAPNDLRTLKQTIAAANAAGLKVVIAPLSLPGARWAQNNNGRFDDRLWQDRRYWEQAANFWRDLALALKDEPGIAAYNLINEPAPEKKGGLAEHASAEAMRDWYPRQVGGTRDLPAFYDMLIKAVREADPVTPVMVDAGWYAAADGFNYWQKPLTDNRVLYSFHMYEPYEATSAPNLKRKKPYTYPGKVPYGPDKQSIQWDAVRVGRYLQQPQQWASQHNIPSSRLVAGEFGCARTLPGCRAYLEDVLTELDKGKLHWAFYSFREDAWDGMDYELGSAKLPWQYWDAVEAGRPFALKRSDNPVFAPISRRLAADR